MKVEFLSNGRASYDGNVLTAGDDQIALGAVDVTRIMSGQRVFIDKWVARRVGNFIYFDCHEDCRITRRTIFRAEKLQLKAAL